MTTPDPDTLVVQLNRPTAGDFLWALTYIDGMVYPPSSFANAATTPVGSGPYVLKSYQPGSSIELVKNPKYWDSKAYPLNAVDFVQVSPGPQAVSAITSGAVDMISLDPQQYSEVKNDPNIGTSITQSYDYTVLETRNDRGPFNNVKVRAALEYAIDRAEINKVVYAGVGRPAYQPFPSNSPGYNKQVGNKYVYDPKKAKAMLAAAGYPHGISFKLDVIANDTTFQRLATVHPERDGCRRFQGQHPADPWKRCPGRRVPQQARRRIAERGPDQRARYLQYVRVALRADRLPGAVPGNRGPGPDARRRSGQRVAQPLAARSPDAKGRRRRHGPGSRDTHRVRAVDHRLQQVGGGREGCGTHRPVPIEPGRNLRQEVSSVVWMRRDPASGPDRLTA